jgi:Family of unknown function (DUF6328)
MGTRSDRARHHHGVASQPSLVSRPPGSTRCPQCQWLAQIDHAEWNHIVRDETELQSVDRHFNELLQELRVAQTGVQILFAFLLGLAFSPRFPDLTGGQQATYLVTLVLSAVSAALLIAPVGYHRTVFRRRLRPQLVTTGHRYAIAGLILLALSAPCSWRRASFSVPRRRSSRPRWRGCSPPYGSSFPWSTGVGTSTDQPSRIPTRQSRTVDRRACGATAPVHQPSGVRDRTRPEPEPAHALHTRTSATGRNSAGCPCAGCSNGQSGGSVIRHHPASRKGSA